MTEKISSKIYNRKSSSIALVDELQSLAEANGLTLSRWQANGSNHATAITYAVHAGARATQFRYQVGVIASAELAQAEGITAKSEAHRKLSRLLNEVKTKLAQ